jgi:hypothetical protein
MDRLTLSHDRYSGPEKFAVETIDVPTIGDDDVLVRHISYRRPKFGSLTHERSKYQHVAFVVL